MKRRRTTESGTAESVDGGGGGLTADHAEHADGEVRGRPPWWWWWLSEGGWLD